MVYICLQDLAAALLCFVSGQLQPAVLRVCLHTLRILSRDHRALGPMVSDTALITLAHLGGIDLLQTCPQQGKDKAADVSAAAREQMHRRTASDHEEETDADVTSASVNSVASFSVPVEVTAAAATNGSGVHCYRWGGDEGQQGLAPGKRDTRGEDMEEEEKEEDWDVCRKEAVKVLCNIIYNSPKAQERASALR